MTYRADRKSLVVVSTEDSNPWNCKSSCFLTLEFGLKKDKCKKPDAVEEEYTTNPSPLFLRKKVSGLYAMPRRKSSYNWWGNTSHGSRQKPATFYATDLPNTSRNRDPFQKIELDDSDASNPYGTLYPVGSTLPSSSSGATTSRASCSNDYDASAPLLDIFSDMNVSDRGTEGNRYSQLPEPSQEPMYENVILEEVMLPWKKSSSAKKPSHSLSSAAELLVYATSLPTSSSFSATSSSSPSHILGISSSSSSGSISNSGQHVPQVSYRHSNPLPIPSGAPTAGLPNPSNGEQRPGNERPFEDPNVPYENLDMDYVCQLTREGYPHDAVIRALGISKNDSQLACDILHEFGTKKNAGQPK